MFRKLYQALRYRYYGALKFWLANHFFMNWMPYRIRHRFLRRFCNVELGSDSSICSGCFITGYRIRIGSNTVINRFTYLDGRVELVIGNNVNISHYTLIQTLTHDPQNPDFVCLEKPVRIEDHVWIGARAMICPGVTIGEGLSSQLARWSRRMSHPILLLAGTLRSLSKSVRGTCAIKVVISLCLIRTFSSSIMVDISVLIPCTTMRTISGSD